MGVWDVGFRFRFRILGSGFTFRILGLDLGSHHGDVHGHLGF